MQHSSDDLLINSLFPGEPIIDPTARRSPSGTIHLSSSAMASSFMTIAEYWESHGYSKAEAKAMEKEQIKAAIAQEELYEAMDGENPYDYF